MMADAFDEALTLRDVACYLSAIDENRLSVGEA